MLAGRYTRLFWISLKTSFFFLFYINTKRTKKIYNYFLNSYCFILQHLKEKKTDNIINECIRQIALADVIILNKTDLVDKVSLNQLENEIK